MQRFLLFICVVSILSYINRLIRGKTFATVEWDRLISIRVQEISEQCTQNSDLVTDAQDCLTWYAYRNKSYPFKDRNKTRRRNTGRVLEEVQGFGKARTHPPEIEAKILSHNMQGNLNNPIAAVAFVLP